MPGISMDIRVELPEAEARFGDRLRSISKGQQDIIRKIALQAVRQIKLSITSTRSVDTGRMRGSVQAESLDQGLGIKAGPRTNYAFYVDQPGITRNWAGRYFMEKAESKLRDDVKLIIDQVVARMQTGGA